MLDRVFHQRLQQQGRQAAHAGLRVQRPLHPQTVAEAHLLNRQVAPASAISSARVDRLPLLDQRVAEQVAQILQQGLGLARARRAPARWRC
jgi:hypothetical protein